MQLTSLSAAPGRRGRPLVRPSSWVRGRTGSQLIRSVRRTMGQRMKQGRRLALALLLLGAVACASSRALDKPYDVPGTPSTTGCDASFDGTGGLTSPGRDHMSFTLRNTSQSVDCKATAVSLQFNVPVSHADLAVSMPAAWTATEDRCENGNAVCGITWRSKAGVEAGQSVGGFEVVTTRQCLPKVWIIQVGSRRVAFPFGCVGGRVGPA